MSAQSLQVLTLDIPNPEWTPNDVNGDAHRINSNISFSFLASFDIQTLSTQNADDGNDVTGLLYVPDLQSDDPCINTTAPYVPKNVTRQANLPNQNYELIAIAPWVTSDCALSYMEAARTDPCRGFLFFVPGNSTSTPAAATDAFWNIDGGTDWKAQNQYPVYAIPGQYGQLLMTESSYYSGNMTQVPYGSDLVNLYDSRDYVRLYADVDLGDATSLPSLWVFLLVVLGILVAIIGLTSLIMHFIQRRRRQALRRRVASGEVDLEALGIKRLTVPQDLLDEMPLYTYGTGRPVVQSRLTNESLTEEKSATIISTVSKPSPALVRSGSYQPTPLSQPTCAICLDDFVAAEAGAPGTTVRELPCHHIFHPECVDVFLRDSSSLCPMCKKTALPKGYCPKLITNAMVRRERMVRQIRERITIEQTENGELISRRPTGLSDRVRMRTMSSLAQFRSARRISDLHILDEQQLQHLEQTSQAPVNPANTTTPVPNSTSSIQPTGPPVQPPSTPGRREWARQRAVAMLGPRAPEDPDREEAQQLSSWRKAVRGLFPRR